MVSLTSELCVTRIDDCYLGEKKEGADILNVGPVSCPVSSYHVIDMPAGELTGGLPLNGIRIDVEKTEM